MRRSIVKIAMAGFLVTSGLVSPALSQELRMAIWSANEAHLALFNEIADEFEASHPGVKITYDSLAYEGYATTLTTQIAGGNPPIWPGCSTRPRPTSWRPGRFIPSPKPLPIPKVTTWATSPGNAHRLVV